jgi:capsular polysaccharide transport system permease protein
MPRTSTAITFSVWKGLFLREALSRILSGRASWFWLLAEPVFHVISLIVIFTLIRVREVGGIETAVWLMVGMLAFFMFRRTGQQVMNAIDANQALFAYRQVKPVDTVLVRGVLEGFLMIIITIILLAITGLWGYSVIPADPLAVLAAFFGLWLLGMGFGLVTSVFSKLSPELAQIIKLAMMPLYLFSGVIFPIAKVPPPYRDWLMYNPIAQALEIVRLGFAPHYHAVPDLSIGYIYQFALASIFLGLVLQRRFAVKLATQ